MFQGLTCCFLTIFTGIWAHSEDESEDEGSRKPTFKVFNKKRPKNYSAPVNFVAGGIQQSGKTDEKKKEENSDEEDDEEERIQGSR